jgi:5'(3')-deoxyribonucleotidase
MIVGTDLDDTINLLVSRWLELYNKDYQDNLKIDDIKNWMISSHTKPECGLKFLDYLKTPKLFYDLGIDPDAARVIAWLIENGVEVQIVTAYIREAMEDKIDFVRKNIPALPEKNIIFCNNKACFNGDYLIDDGVHNLDAFLSRNPNGKVLLFDRPWNWSAGDKYPRVHNWLEIEDYFRKIFSKD